MCSNYTSGDGKNKMKTTKKEVIWRRLFGENELIGYLPTNSESRISLHDLELTFSSFIDVLDNTLIS